LSKVDLVELVSRALGSVTEVPLRHTRGRNEVARPTDPAIWATSRPDEDVTAAGPSNCAASRTGSTKVLTLPD